MRVAVNRDVGGAFLVLVLVLVLEKIEIEDEDEDGHSQFCQPTG